GRGAAVAAAVACSVALSACGGGGTLSSRVVSWARSANLEGSSHSLVSYVSQVRSEEHAGKVGQAELGCIGVADAAGNADNQLTTPDPTLSTELDRAYQGYFRFGAGCEHRHGHLSAALLAQAAAAKGELGVALRRYRSLTGIQLAATSATKG
ncbi:MAG: hypothetical protein ACRDYD_08260, partial [Acidimicrobiales bacterium]